MLNKNPYDYTNAEKLELINAILVDLELKHKDMLPLLLNLSRSFENDKENLESAQKLISVFSLFNSHFMNFYLEFLKTKKQIKGE